jgi:hypothetical protein
MRRTSVPSRRRTWYAPVATAHVAYATVGPGRTVASTGGPDASFSHHTGTPWPSKIAT